LGEKIKSRFSEVTAMIHLVQNRVQIWALIRISGFIQAEFLDQLQYYGYGFKLVWLTPHAVTQNFLVRHTLCQVTMLLEQVSPTRCIASFRFFVRMSGLWSPLGARPAIKTPEM